MWSLPLFRSVLYQFQDFLCFVLPFQNVSSHLSSWCVMPFSLSRFFLYASLGIALLFCVIKPQFVSNLLSRFSSASLPRASFSNALLISCLHASFWVLFGDWGRIRGVWHLLFPRWFRWEGPKVFGQYVFFCFHVDLDLCGLVSLSKFLSHTLLALKFHAWSFHAWLFMFIYIFCDFFPSLLCRSVGMLLFQLSLYISSL